MTVAKNAELSSEDVVGEALLTTATEIIARAGFEAIRLRDVASKAKVALGTPSYKFKNRQGLFLAALERANSMQNAYVINEYKAGLDKPPAEAALRFLWARVHFAQDHPSETLLRAHAVYSNHVPGFRAIIGRFADENMVRIEHIVERLEQASLVEFPELPHKIFFLKSYTYLGFSFSQSAALSFLDSEVTETAILKLEVACAFEALMRSSARPAGLLEEVKEKYKSFLAE